MISIPTETEYDSPRGIRSLILRATPRQLEPLINVLPLPDLDFCRVTIEGKEHIACVDNQASASILSLRFATKNQIAVEQVNVPFTLADGSIEYSAGRALLQCAVGRRVFPHCEFYILRSTIQPVILGRQLLHESGLLKCPRHTIPRFPQMKYLARPISAHHCTIQDHRYRSQIGILLESHHSVKEACALPDKGSSQNIMSLAYATSMGYSVDRQPNNKVTLKLGNGVFIQSSGTVEAYLRLRGTAGQTRQLGSRFIVIDGLPFDLAVGNTFIRKYKVFDKRISDIEWSHDEEENLHFCPVIKTTHNGKGPLARKNGAFIIDFSDRDTIPIVGRSRDIPDVPSETATAGPSAPVIDQASGAGAVEQEPTNHQLSAPPESLTKHNGRKQARIENTKDALLV